MSTLSQVFLSLCPRVGSKIAGGVRGESGYSLSSWDVGGFCPAVGEQLGLYFDE